MKKVLLIGAVLALLAGGVAVGGLVYLGFQVKGRVERVARELSAEPRSRDSRPPAEVAGRRIDACALLTPEEAAEILGVAIERTQSKQGAVDSTCEYFARPRSKQERGTAVATIFKDMSERGDRPSPPGRNTPVDALRQSGMEGLLKEISGLASPDGPYLAVTVNWDGGRTAISMLKLVSGVSAPGLETTEGLEGIGDEAVMGAADSVLAFVKGRTGVQIGLSLVPQGRDRGIAIARKIASRL
jgi:hypothetical protein